MLWKKCVVRGGLVGLGAGVAANWLGAAIGGPFALMPHFLPLVLMSTAAGGLTGLVTLMWLRGAAQVGGSVSPLRAGLTAGLVVGAIVGAGGSLLVGLLAGNLLGTIIPSAIAGISAGAVTGAAGIPLGHTVKGWLEAE